MATHGSGRGRGATRELAKSCMELPVTRQPTLWPSQEMCDLAVGTMIIGTMVMLVAISTHQAQDKRSRALARAQTALVHMHSPQVLIAATDMMTAFDERPAQLIRRSSREPLMPALIESVDDQVLHEKHRSSVAADRAVPGEPRRLCIQKSSPLCDFCPSAKLGSNDDTWHGFPSEEDCYRSSPVSHLEMHGI